MPQIEVITSTIVSAQITLYHKPYCLKYVRRKKAERRPECDLTRDSRYDAVMHH